MGLPALRLTLDCPPACMDNMRVNKTRRIMCAGVFSQAFLLSKKSKYDKMPRPTTIKKLNKTNASIINYFFNRTKPIAANISVAIIPDNITINLEKA